MCGKTREKTVKGKKTKNKMGFQEVKNKCRKNKIDFEKRIKQVVLDGLRLNVSSVGYIYLNPAGPDLLPS